MRSVLKRTLLRIVPPMIALLLGALWIPVSKPATPPNEAMLDELFTLRSLLNQYTLDKQKCARSLQDLVTAGYLKEIPTDPMTGRKDTWVFVTPDHPKAPCIDGIQSGSGESNRSGSPNRSW